MATIPSIDIPNALVAPLVAAADELLDARKIDRTGMTQVQRGKRYLIEVIKDVVVSRSKAAAEVTAKVSVDAAVATATTDAGGIV
jgi:hypothetical protein